MSNNISEFTINSSNRPSADDLKNWSAQLDDATRARAPRIENYIGRGTTQTTIANGRIETRLLAKTTATARSALPAGMVEIPGLGRTTIEAAISAGLLPEGWTPRPFDHAAPTAGGGNVPPSGPVGATAGDAEDHGPEFASRKLAVDEASRLLSEVNASVGQDVLDGVLHYVADTGALEGGILPEGVTQETVAAIHAGYAAQAEHTLSEVGTSVAGLVEMLNDDELRSARQAVIGGDKDRLKELGSLANRRLGQLDTADPDRFRQMVEQLPADQRKAIRYDNDHRAWIVTIPGAGSMSYGAAVSLGFVRF